jgi:hypothetical protein
MVKDPPTDLEEVVVGTEEATSKTRQAQRVGACRSGPSGAYTAACSPNCEGVGSVVLRTYGGCYASSEWLLESS